MGKFKIGNWVYTYDEQGLVYKHQVRGNVGVFYDLTGKSEPVNTQYIFKTKKECLKAMKDAGIQKASLHMATVIKLENKISDLETKLAESENENKKIMDLYWNEIAGYEAEVKELKQQLAENEEYIKYNVPKLIEANEMMSKQLAEKENEIKQLKAQSAVDEDWLCSQRARLTELEDELSELRFKERNINGLIEQLPNQNQTAIEELEKVKELIKKHIVHLVTVNYKRVAVVNDLFDQIDQQIKSLKGEK